MEKWKKIKGWDSYEVSNYGKVRSLDKIVKWAHHGKTGDSRKKGQILSPIPRVMGKFTTYAQVNLYDSSNKKRKCELIHRLVARAFIPNLENKPQVNHIDGNGMNNHVNNLEWVTSKENSQHARRVLNRKSWHAGNLGKNTPTAKAVLQKTLKGDLIKKWDAAMDAVRKHGFDSSGISNTCHGKQKVHKGYIWEYAEKK